jgi:hypothetical protein
LSNLIQAPKFLLSLALLCWASVAFAQLSFSHKEWQLVCDNTGTCRAAGYQATEDSLPASLSIERAAGAKQAVKMFITLDGSGNDQFFEMPTNLSIDKALVKNIGNLSEKNEFLELNTQTIQKILELLSNSNYITLQSKKLKWNISLDGAKAVLLKMDEMQRRIGTTGALISKGLKDESTVLPAKEIKTITIPRLTKTTAKDLKLLPLLSKLMDKNSCDKAFDENEKLLLDNFELIRLNKDNLAIFNLNCWSGAYNSGGSAWLVRDKEPYKLELIADSINDYSDGVFSGVHKGRGIGDCWSSSSWVWNGQTIEQAASSTSGFCKGFMGGAWDLPTLVSKVVNLNETKQDKKQ